MAAHSSDSPKRHRRRDHVPRHRRIEPGPAARAAVLGTAGAVAVGAAFGLANVSEDDVSESTHHQAALDAVFHERADQAASRGVVGRAPVAGFGAHSRAQAPAVRPAPAAPAPPPAPTDVPEECDSYSGNRLRGCTLLDEFGFGLDQMPALDNLWTRESGWNHQAENPSSGAYGIPQSLPGNKMATVGDDWRTNPDTQIRWGLGYIQDRYGDPQSAWVFFQSNGWY